MSDAKTERRKACQSRNMLLWLLLCICTLGIYNLWFISRWADDVNLMCADDGDVTPGLGQFLLCDILTFGVYKYVWFSRLADRLADNAPRFGVDDCTDGEAAFLLFILCLPLFGIGPFLALGLVMSDSNKLARAYNAGLAGHPASPARPAVAPRPREAAGPAALPIAPKPKPQNAAAPHPREAAGGLLGTAGSCRGRRVSLGHGERVMIGRGSDADVAVKSVYVARRHCTVSYNAKTREYSLEVLGANGVYADGKRLTPGGRHTLRSGTTIKLADGSEQFKLL